MSINFKFNGKQVQCKNNDKFADIFDEYISKGKFQDQIWILNAQVLSGILKNTKIIAYVKEDCNLECYPKTHPIGLNPCPHPIDLKTCPCPCPFPINLNPQPIQSDPKQRIQIDDRTGEEQTEFKIVKEYKVQIKDYGKTVILEKVDGSFQVIFLEENASEKEQNNIMLQPQDVIISPEYQLKLSMGQDQKQFTKILFLKDFKGIAIKWVTGLQTKFEFQLDN
ncbi:unnamed protein product [Paramecium pentaurelia]|uniref:Uncharacterized protein n=1 Tax=Paramecium pentaurelia TaxID=43138 RepID=A0A8S1S380_9CILI|nr:unnamed protein product [Paramecium pentaurelia]